MAYWFALVAAIVLEVAGTTSMKFAAGFTRPLPSVLIFVFYGLSFGALTIAIKEIDLSIAYAMWAGVGTAAIALIAWIVFGETMTAWKVASLGLIVAGVVGLHLS